MRFCTKVIKKQREADLQIWIYVFIKKLGRKNERILCKIFCKVFYFNLLSINDNNCQYVLVIKLFLFSLRVDLVLIFVCEVIVVVVRMLDALWPGQPAAGQGHDDVDEDQQA